MFTRNRWLHSCLALTADSWRHGWSDSDGPEFKSAPDSEAHTEAMTDLCRTAGLDRAAWCAQEHGGQVLEAEGPGLAGAADALWTRMPGLGVVGRSADCPLVLLGGMTGDGARLAGFAHASWRSTVRGITGSLAGAMLDAGARAETLIAVICPSAGPCCYEVGPEVRAEAMERLDRPAAEFFQTAGRKYLLDLWAANAAQLMQAGVAPDRIHRTGWCTICGGPRGDLRFPSYRRQGQDAGRFAAIIGFAR